MVVDFRKIIDDLYASAADIETLKEAPSPKVKPEEALNLSFPKGRKVKDKVTGKKGEILYGTRKRVPRS